MKKRQHFPNAHTYTILLNGLSRYHELGGRDKLEKTIDSLLHDKRIKPSVIHLNAVLSVCLKSKNLQLAYDTIERFSEAGMDEHDVVTYDTLFRLIKTVIEKEAVPGERYRERTITADARQCLDDSKNIWKDVEALWRSGHLSVDSQLLKSYTAVLARGSKEDWEAGISAIETLCELPSFASSEGKMEKTAKGARVSLDQGLFAKLLELAEMMQNAALAEHYWQNAKAATTETLSQGTYEARLRSLTLAKSPEKATALLDEMKAAGVPIGPLTLFLALQCFFTHRPSTDLERACTFLREYADVETGQAWQTVPILTTLAKFVKSSREAGPSTDAFRLLRTVDWHRLATEAGGVPHHRQRLREAIRQLIRSCRSVRRSLDDRQDGTTTPPDDAKVVVQKLVKALLTVQAEFYSQDVTS